MTTEAIIESGMTFGPYPDGHCFYIEDSKSYRNIKADGVKIAEFLLLQAKENKPPIIVVVEAKKSSPQLSSLPNFDDYIGDIREKFINSLALFIAIYLKRHEDGSESELPHHFQQLELSRVKFVLILVINGHKVEWLPPLQDALQRALKPTVKIWSLSLTSVIILNVEGARDHGLINAI
jgi:hypothetical protein